jgi:uncharacterized membrane protein (DUF106 family)
MFLNPTVDLVIVAGFFSIIAQTMQLVLMDRKSMRETQKKMKEKNKEYREIVKKGNMADKSEMDRVQKEMMDLTSESMKRMPKMMVANLVVFLPLFWMVSSEYSGSTINLIFPFSLIAQQVDWFWWYLIASLLISIVVNRTLTMYDNHIEKKKAEEETPAETVKEEETVKKEETASV